MQSWKRSFYQSFFKLYIVLTFQNVITLSVNLADNMMPGAYSEISLSAAAAVNQVQFIYQQIPGAFGGGIVNAFLIVLSIIFVPMSYQMPANFPFLQNGIDVTHSVMRKKHWTYQPFADKIKSVRREQKQVLNLL